MGQAGRFSAVLCALRVFVVQCRSPIILGYGQPRQYFERFALRLSKRRNNVGRRGTGEEFGRTSPRLTEYVYPSGGFHLGPFHLPAPARRARPSRTFPAIISPAKGADATAIPSMARPIAVVVSPPVRRLL